VPLTYQSGQEIKKGDRVLYFEEPGEIEFVADPLIRDDETTWFVEEHGVGVMINEPKHFGHVFIGKPEDDCELIFVSRQE
jgi:hypothetical protein